MILPIVAYGDPVLRKKSEIISKDHASLDQLILNMFDTMNEAGGIGLAAPQIGLALRLFIVDGTPTDELREKGFKKIFINPIIVEEAGEEWVYEEGCLSIPGIRDKVSRKPIVTITYFDEKWVQQTEKYDGLAARIIQHEYDHIEGILFTDKLTLLKKQLIKGKLANISRGKTDADYKMRFPLVSKKR